MGVTYPQSDLKNYGLILLRPIANSPEKLQIIGLEHLEHDFVGHILRDSVVEVAEPEDDIGLSERVTITT